MDLVSVSVTAMAKILAVHDSAGCHAQPVAWSRRGVMHSQHLGFIIGPGKPVF